MKHVDPSKQAGMTLIELMISLVLSLITIAAAIALYIVMFKGNVLSIRSTKLNHDVDALLQVIANDIRRAGYWGGSKLDIDPTINPFTASPADLSISTYAGSDCITYAYDVNGNSSIDNDEMFGFRLESTGVIEMRVSVTTSSAGASCSEGTWVPMTTDDGLEQVSVANLDVSITGSSCDNTDDSISAPYKDVFCSTALASAASGNRLVGRRIINISLDATTSMDSQILKSSATTITVANDSVVKK